MDFIHTECMWYDGSVGPWLVYQGEQDELISHQANAKVNREPSSDK